MPLSVLGRPPLRRECVQRRATSCRCQRKSVTGETKKRRPGRPGQRAAQRGQQQPVGWPQPRPRDLTLQHMQPVAQQENLELLRPLRTQTEHNELEQTPQHPIHERAQQPNRALPVDALTIRTQRARRRLKRVRQPLRKSDKRPPKSLYGANRIFGTHTVTDSGC